MPTSEAGTQAAKEIERRQFEENQRRMNQSSGGGGGGGGGGGSGCAVALAFLVPATILLGGAYQLLG